MTDPFTAEQEVRIRGLAIEIAAAMIAQALHGAGDRIAEAINGTIVLLPVIHADRDTSDQERHHV